ncbi:uncharacterized protein LOC133716831 [Rosa rugosa]|uniref:uncharacterized protein LOC133716831 n=1 Tax=Rosa rugosa TaxID=74645 RepID=UPI002B40AB12|nr:uncharacterized protein LOC133716831 [Rosa rugosa]
MDDRQKLDGFILFNTVSPQDSQDLEINSMFNIRKSLAWDSAFFTNPGVLEPEELLQTTSSGATGNAVNLLGNEEEILLPSESLEPERTRKFESCSYRKSLTWDNAFYTSPGVLDPEELSIVNKGFKKSESHQLLAIQEVWRSTESKSTTDSGSSALASLEFELFGDKMLSMQKPASLKLKRGRGLQNVHSTKKTDASSRVKMKASASQRQNLNNQPERILKEVFVSSQRQLAAGSGKFIPTASLKQPKLFSGVSHSSTAATRRSSLGGNYVKMGTAKAARGQCSTLSKKPCLRASSGIVTHSSTPSPKLSSSGSPAAKDTSESPMNSRRKFDYALDDFAANGLTMSNPLRFTKKNKDELESSCQDSGKMFTPKSTIYASSAASLDGWSSESSSSSMSQRSISSQISFGSDASQASDTVHCVGQENQETSLPDQNMKPSGLRVPSPKIGFFDEEITLVQARGSMHFHSVVPSTVSQNGGAKLYGKLKPPRNFDGKNNVQKVLNRVNKECTKENEEPNIHCPGENMCSGQDNSDGYNTYYFKNQIEGLTEQVGIIDLGCDVVMEFRPDKNAFHA